MAIEMPTTFTTDTGVEFHLEENATNYASKLGLKGVRVWRTHIATSHRYTILDRNTPIYVNGVVHALSRCPDNPMRFNHLQHTLSNHQSQNTVYEIKFDPLYACLGVDDEGVYFAGLDVTETGVYVFIDTFNK